MDLFSAIIGTYSAVCLFLFLITFIWRIGGNSLIKFVSILAWPIVFLIIIGLACFTSAYAIIAEFDK